VNYLLSEKSLLSKFKGNLGEDDYKEPLSMLLDSLNNEANLSLIGKTALRYQIKSHLKIRSKIFEFLEGKELEKPASPIFVIGLPRSGTTFLFNLLSLDSNHRSPLAWEMFFPFPIVEQNTKGYKRRVKKTDFMMFFQRKLIPGLDLVHPIQSTDPEECLLITPFSLKSLLYSYMARIPSYEDYLKQTDHASVFLWHSRFLQVLESFQRPKRWLLKDPGHIGRLHEILAVYPEASFIQIHRDPVETIPSICSLTEKTRRPFTKRINKNEIGARTLSYWEGSLAKGEKEKSNISQDKFINLKFEDFIVKPIEQIKVIYSQLDLNLDKETERKMVDFVQNFEKVEKAKHSYELSEFGLSKESVQNTLSKYISF
jgi:hypothetical protein